MSYCSRCFTIPRTIISDIDIHTTMYLSDYSYFFFCRFFSMETNQEDSNHFFIASIIPELGSVDPSSIFFYSNCILSFFSAIITHNKPKDDDKHVEKINRIQINYHYFFQMQNNLEIIYFNCYILISDLCIVSFFLDRTRFTFIIC